MNPTLLTLAILVGFVLSFVGGFAGFSWLVEKTIGYYREARLLAYTPGDARSAFKHKRLLALVLFLLAGLGGGAYTCVVSASWFTVALAAVIGLTAGVLVSFWLGRNSLTPEGWPPSRR